MCALYINEHPDHNNVDLNSESVNNVNRHSAMKDMSCKSLQALVGAAKGERSGGVRRAYASTAAQVAKFAPEPRVAKLVADAVELFHDPGVRLI